ncbi:hypothetical protein DFP72DRAFT_859041 [Ephemerocybe angulata]|uniref:Uncharacterized protein n=1 Tax=Ephemerocybe angulata TaxID=980116 RepID=A0A8H6HA90_9AGAR|nr:hypothetical protein DFP72DRAFT_859041 [Tulosesus angulatus]
MASGAAILCVHKPYLRTVMASGGGIRCVQKVLLLQPTSSCSRISSDGIPIHRKRETSPDRVRDDEKRTTAYPEVYRKHLHTHRRPPSSTLHHVGLSADGVHTRVGIVVVDSRREHTSDDHRTSVELVGGEHSRVTLTSHKRAREVIPAPVNPRLPRTLAPEAITLCEIKLMDTEDGGSRSHHLSHTVMASGAAILYDQKSEPPDAAVNIHADGARKPVGLEVYGHTPVPSTAFIDLAALSTDSATTVEHATAHRCMSQRPMYAVGDSTIALRREYRAMSHILAL